MGKPAKPLLFLKLGGSLITDKACPHTARLDTLTRLVDELASFKLANPDAQVLLGHGSGSFGHIPAQRHSTREGVRSEDEWTGFVEVWRQANALNRIVVDALGRGGLNAISFSPSGCVLARDGLVASWDLAPIQVASSTHCWAVRSCPQRIYLPTWRPPWPLSEYCLLDWSRVSGQIFRNAPS